jgi:protein O-mannosyl-transferase
VCLVFPPLLAVAGWVRAILLERRERHNGTLFTAPSSRLAWTALGALALLWVPVAYFPHSNIPVLLPTVRAERFWYLPAMGMVLLMTPAIKLVLKTFPSPRVMAMVALWFGFQAAQARWHAFDYTDDLIFWRATKNSVKDSAKAHLNYSVMVGARGRLDERLVANRRALELAPKWAMAHVYLGDTLCRLHRPKEAWPSYKRGFELAPNDSNLIALALQCLWDEKSIEPYEDELLALSDKHPGSWLAYLGSDIVHHGEKHGGVEKKYRPRSYDGGPKDD